MAVIENKPKEAAKIGTYTSKNKDGKTIKLKATVQAQADALVASGWEYVEKAKNTKDTSKDKSAGEPSEPKK